MNNFNKLPQTPTIDTSELDKAGLVSMDEKPQLTEEELDTKYGVNQPVAHIKVSQANPSEKVDSTQEKSQVDVVALNNHIIRMSPKDKKEALNNLSPEEVVAVGENIGTFEDFDRINSVLNNFDFKSEIMEQPGVIKVLKKCLTDGIHIYNVERVLSMLPESEKGMLNDPSVKAGLIKSSIRYLPSNHKSARDEMLPIIRKMGLTNEELRTIAESQEIKNNNEAYDSFVKYFGHKNIYPEL